MAEVGEILYVICVYEKRKGVGQKKPAKETIKKWREEGLVSQKPREDGVAKSSKCSE